MHINHPTEAGEVTLSDGDDGIPRLAHWRCPMLARVCTVPLAPQNPRGWAFDGNRAAPTLSPSIQCLECGWHGYIKGGILVNAEG